MNSNMLDTTPEKIILTFLENIDNLSERERKAITEYIELKNKPIFTSTIDGKDITRLIASQC